MRRCASWAPTGFSVPVDESGTLGQYRGRHADGTDLNVLTAYSASLVERVHADGKPLVVTSDEEGRALGSQSAAAHGLLSIMVAPLQLKGRVLGVVYLDSRVAKGIFTGEDVDILMAIINHVAVSLETARAAQLEVAVQAARRRQDMAETLRTAMSEVSQTLDPDEVLGRLLSTVARIVPGQAACLLRTDGETLTVAATRGQADTTAIGQTIDPATDQTLWTLVHTTRPTLGSTTAAQSAPLPKILPGARSWIAAPLTGRAGTVGLLLHTSTTPDAYTDADVEIAAALSGQGMVAYENACLFDQVRHLATIDGLTGIYNRRHFLELATDRFAAARTQRPAPAAIMMDVDHFKKTNDTYGHVIGDEILQEIAIRLRSTIGTGDLIARYGGEEFAAFVVTPGTDADHLAERLRTTIAATPMTTAAGPVHLTISIGVAHADPGCPDLGTMLARADDALYQAKRAGRNRVATAPRG